MITVDGKDLLFITFELVDEEGNVVHKANKIVTFSIDGPAGIVATNNRLPYSFLIQG